MGNLPIQSLKLDKAGGTNDLKCPEAKEKISGIDG